jgi:hypothetical protein
VCFLVVGWVCGCAVRGCECGLRFSLNIVHLLVGVFFGCV